MALPRMPRPDEVELHVHARGGQLGPISRLVLKTKIDAGEVVLTDHLWMEGMAGWERLSDHPTLLEGLDEAPAPAAAAATEAPRAGESEDDFQDRVFGELVRGSWNYLGEHRFANHIDEVFLGAIITSTLDTGYSLIDLNSDGSHHYLRFENLQDRTRIIVRLTHLTPSLAVSKVLGQRVSAVIGYGEKVGNITKIFGAIQAEMKSAYLDPEPGTITVDGDLNSGYVYCQVDLYLDIEQYVARDYTIDYPKLSGHIGATTHALRKYLRGRFA